jgi:hypothetical protein
MKYVVDVRKVSEDVRSFTVEAKSADLARIKALVLAENEEGWILDTDDCNYFPLMVSGVK